MPVDADYGKGGVSKNLYFYREVLYVMYSASLLYFLPVEVFRIQRIMLHL